MTSVCRERQLINAYREMRTCHILLAAWCAFAPASILFGQLPPQRFSSMTVKDGLPSNQVLCIAKDSLGFIWYGTSLGLVRHDGVHFDVFSTTGKGQPRLPSERISQIMVDKSNILWIRTGDGHLCTFDYRKSHVKQIETVYLKPDDKGLQQVGAMVDRGDGYIYAFCRDWTVFKIATQSGQITEVMLSDTLIPQGGPVTALAAYDRCWLGTYRGFYEYDWRQNKYTEINIDTLLAPGERSQPEVRAIERYGEASLLLGGWRLRHLSFYGLLEYNTVSGKCSKLNGPVDGAFEIGDYATEIIYRINSDEYMLQGAYRGPYYFNFHSHTGDTIIHDLEGLNRLHTVSVNCWFSEPGGRIMCGTNQGVFIYDPAEHLFHEFYPYHKIKRFPNQLSSIHHDQKTNTLIIAANDMLYTYAVDDDTTLAQMKLPRLPKHILSQDRLTPQIIPVAEDTLLVLSNQLFLVNIRTWQYMLLPFPNDLPDDDARYHRWVMHSHPYLAPIQDFYFVKDGMLLHLSHREMRIRRIPIVDPDGTVIYPIARAILTDRKGILWIADNSARLYRVITGDTALAQKFLVLNTHETTIRDLLIDEGNDLWIATQHHGLVRARFAADTLHFTQFATEHGLHTPGIFQLLEDSYGRLWMSTHYGISCFDKQTQTFRNYGKQHGINYPHNMRMGKGMDQQGRLYFSQGIAITQFDPSDFLQKEDAPPVYIKEFRILDSVVSGFWRDTSITLTWRQNKFSFKIAAASHTHGFMNRYAYLLENYNTDWIETNSEDLLINFNNLKGGNYVFRARAANHEGTWNQKGINIAIAVLPPFWETWWFATALVVFILSAIGMAFYLRVQQIRRQELMLIRREVEIQTGERQRIARDLHDDIGAQLSTVNMYIEAMQSNGHRATDEAEQLRAEAQQLIRRTISDMSHIITELSPQALTTYGYAAAVHEFLYHVRKSTEVEVSYDLSRFTSRLDPTAEAALFRITQELFNNTIKHANAQKITFSISTHNDKIVFTYTDDGQGFDHQKVLQGRGLHNIASRVKLLGGKISLRSEAHKGVKYFIEFPNPSS